MPLSQWGPDSMCVLLPGGSYTREPYLGRGSFPHKLSKYRASAGAVAVPPPIHPPTSPLVRAVRKNRSVLPLVQVPLVAHRIAPVLELKDAFLLSTSWCLICLIFEHICDNRINVGWTCHTLDRGTDNRANPVCFRAFMRRSLYFYILYWPF